MDPLRIYQDHWGEASGLALLGDGHINQTWRVESADGLRVLQQINRRVFTSPGMVMDNLRHVLDHVKRVPLPRLLPTRQGESHVVVEGEWYRVWRFVQGGIAKKSPETAVEAERVARAFGTLLAELRSLPVTLTPPIPGFHSFRHFWDQYKTHGLVSEYDDLLERCDAQRTLLAAVTGAIHGDCKFANVLLSNQDSQVLAVLDLDTLMPGHWGFDWGDLVRSAFVDREVPDEMMLRGLYRGFAQALGSLDIAVLLFAPLYVTCTLGVRYLVDHHIGDRWFTVERHGNNLTRAARQFRFALRWEQEATRVGGWIEAERRSSHG
jgi:aminoglycoside phosphotransferase (APT) family kinase protein